MSTSTTLMTAEELIQLPRDPFRYELIGGELKKMPPPGYPHGRITMRLAGPLAQFVWEHGLGEVLAAETGFKLTSDPDTVLAPDISFITRQRFGEWSETEGYWPGPPDLAVEVLSPTDRASEVTAKVSRWLHFGTKQVWVVDPEHSMVIVHCSAEDIVTFSEGDFEADDLLPGFRISLDRIFKI